MSFKTATFVIATGLSCAVASAQNDWWMPRAQRVEDAVLIEEPAPIRLLFQRAEEGIARRDWKFAIDSLQRILEDPKGSLVESTDRLRGAVTRYESASSRALRRLLALPPEGLEAYRVLYDGRARRLIERAESQHDPSALREIVEHYLASSHGAEAVDRLASWLLDAGAPSRALAVLAAGEVIGQSSGGARLREALRAKRAAGYALLGQTASLDAWLERESSSRTLPEWFNEIRHLSPVGADALDARGAAPDWPIMGGPPHGHGRMPSVTPSQPIVAQWDRDIGGPASGVWYSRVAEGSTEPRPLPVGHPVLASGRLFLRSVGGCFAIDLDGFSTIWATGSRDESLTDRLDRRARLKRRSWATSDLYRTAFEDYVEGAISIAGGLVLTVDRGFEGVQFEPPTDTRRRRFMNFLVPADTGIDPQSWATRLTARDADTGRVRWRRGRRRDPSDPLASVQFRSVPIEVGDDLWVPFIGRDELAVAVLNPETGELRRQILLCSVTRPAINLAHAITPAYSVGTVFVPSAQGALFAVDAELGTLRWATIYARVPATDGWLSGPPIVIGDTVLLAPTDHRKLWAFSTATGEVRWSTVDRGQQYLIAAAGRRLWTGGRHITCRDVETGAEIWSRVIPSTPTGRAVLSGSEILIPTMTGLSVFGAETGEVVRDQRLAQSSEPMGNILCVEGALISVDPASVRKFPDLEHAYPRALAAHARDANDTRAAIRLAWLELFRGEPLRALEVASGLSSETGEGGGARAAEVSHLRAEVALALAVADGTDAGRSLERLQRSATGAHFERDRLRCAIAAAESLIRMGRAIEAYETLWTLGLSPAADQMISRSPRVEVRARRNIRARLAEIEARLSQEESDSQRARCAAIIAGAASRLSDPEQASEAHRRLRAIADMNPGETSSMALLALGHAAAISGRFEEAEQHFLRALRVGGSEAITIEALMRLSELYGDEMQTVSSAVGIRQAATRTLDRLIADHGPSAVPEALRAGDSGPQAVAEWALHARAEFAARQATVAGHLAGTAVDPPGWQRLPDDPIWRMGIPDRMPTPRLVRFDAGRPDALSDRMLLFGWGDVLYWHELIEGRLIGRTELRTVEEFRVEQIEVSGRRRGVPSIPRRYAQADGQTMMIAGPAAIHAVGLVSGKRLWNVPYEVDDAGASFGSRDAMIAAADGLLAAMPSPGKLSVMRAVDGETIWTHDLRGESVGFVWIHRDRVVLADAYLERVHLLNLVTGERIGRIDLGQPDPEHDAITPVFLGDVVCGPVFEDGAYAVAGFDLATGVLRWRVPLDRELLQIFQLNEGLLGVGLLGGGVLVLDASSGARVFEVEVEADRGAVDGLWIDGGSGGDTMLLELIRYERDGAYPVFVGIDVSAGEERWRREDLVSGELWNDPLTDVKAAWGEAETSGFDGRLPIVFRTGRSGDDGPLTEIEFGFLDVWTGEMVGPTVDLLSIRAGSALVGDYGVWPGVFTVATDSEIRAFSMDALNKDSIDDDASSEGS